ncbi:hypothetical protein C2E23DRAFT_512941 [Lenzites betulinus]|nr:hypothetical protein C2E23DRAFT_512941 [Lenzites betulinus]
MFTRLGAERVAASLRKIVTAPPKTLFVWLVASNPFCRDGFRVPDVQAESLLLMALTLSPSTVNPLEMDPKRDSPFAAALMIMESMDCIPLSFATLQIPSATTQNEPRLSTTATGTQPLLTLGYIFASLLVAFAVYYMRQHYPLRYIHMTFAFPPLTGCRDTCPRDHTSDLHSSDTSYQSLHGTTTALSYVQRFDWNHYSARRTEQRKRR